MIFPSYLTVHRTKALSDVKKMGVDKMGTSYPVQPWMIHTLMGEGDVIVWCDISI